MSIYQGGGKGALRDGLSGIAAEGTIFPGAEELEIGTIVDD